MKIKLTPSYLLTDECGTSLPKIPVLVNVRTKQVYHATDMLEAYPSWGNMAAFDVVKRMVSWGKFSDKERYFIERFTGKLFS